MLKFMDNLPDNVLGIEVSGTVTREDYAQKLIPLCDEKLARHGRIGLLYVIGNDFDSYELGAMWADMSYGLKHWHDVTHIAMVSDHAALKGMAALFAPFFPGEMKFYDLADVEEARTWITESAGNKKAA